MTRMQSFWFGLAVGAVAMMAWVGIAYNLNSFTDVVGQAQNITSWCAKDTGVMIVFEGKWVCVYGSEVGGYYYREQADQAVPYILPSRSE